MQDIIKKVKLKKEFSQIPDSLVEKVLKRKEIIKKDNENKIKLTRSYLRKYFGVFLTNKVLKVKDESILLSHISSKKRDYDLLYSPLSNKIDSNVNIIIDLGCGVNGFSYKYLKNYFGNVKYLGVEAIGQVCDTQNNFFRESKLNAKVICDDLTELGVIKRIISKEKSPKVIFLFQSIDALEAIEPNFFKKLVNLFKETLSDSDFVVISNSKKTISGKNKESKEKKWVEYVFRGDFSIVDRFEMFDEEFLIAKLI